MCGATAGHLREAAGLDPDNPRLRELVRPLTEHSRDFARLWTTHTVRGKTQDAKYFLHPDVGALALTYQGLRRTRHTRPASRLYQAQPGDPRAQAVLGSTRE